MRPSKSAIQRPGRYVPALLALTFLIFSVSASATDDVWVRIHHSASDPAIASFSLDESLSDYGNMQWGQISAAQAAELEAAGVRISTVENPFVLSLGGETFDPLDESILTSRFQPYQADPQGDFHLVQFNGPIRKEWLDSVRSSGVDFVQYIHPYSYVVWADSSSLATTRNHESVRWVGDFLPEYRVVPDQRSWTDAEEPVIIAVSKHVNQRQLAFHIRENGGELIEVTPYTSSLSLVKALVPGPRFLDVSRTAGVYTMQRAMRMTTRGEMSNQAIVGNYGDAPNFTIVPGYSDWLASTGLDGSGVIVSIMDSGVRSTHVDLADRMLPCTPSASPSTCGSPASSHGTHVAGAVAGTGATGTMLDGFLRGQGVAPGANLISQIPPNLNSWWGVACDGADPEAGEFCLTPDGMLRLFKEAATNGAVLANNSWGSPGFQYGYDVISQQVDVLVRNADPDGATPSPVLPLWSIQNGSGDRQTGSVCDPASLGSPEEAKNAFAVGATRQQNSNTGAQVTGSQIFSVGQNSAHGPACDGRTNPDIVAPGWSTDSTGSGSDTAHAFAGGTSMASPVVSGASAIFIEYYRNLFDGATPSPAMIKAALSGVAMNMHGQENADGGTITETPSRFQGWGRLDLDAAVNPTESVMYFDQETVFTATGQDWSIPIVADNVNEPIRLMLMWTDAPGHGLSGSTPAWVNLLDLSADTANGIFLGNQIGADGFSELGGNPDDRNNMEGIFLRPDQHGGQSFEVTVTAAQIVADALDPWNPDVSNPRQDFALVCYNCQFGEDTFSLGISPTQLDACLPDSGSINEDIAVAVGALAEYQGTVALSSSGEPAGTSSSILPGSVNAPGNAIWTLTIGDSAAAGNYTISLVGDDGDESKAVELALQLDAFLAEGPALNSPADGDQDTSLTPGFQWADLPDVEDYRIQVATDNAFASIVIDESVAATSFTPAAELNTGTEYFWRVQGSNLCGGGEWSQTLSFTTRLEPVAEFSADSFSFVMAGNASDDATLEISNIGTGNLTWSIETDQLESTAQQVVRDDHEPSLDEVLDVPAFSVTGAAGGGPVVNFEIPAGISTRGTVIGFTFEGTVSGPSGSGDWASDMRMVITSPEGQSFDVGGFSSPANSWSFQGSGSASDGTYTSTHIPVFGTEGTDDEGDWELSFRHGWNSDSAGTMNWSDVTIILHKQPLPFCGEELTNVPWMTASPASGVTAAGETDDVQINIDSTGLAAGDYTGYLCISTNDPAAELFPIAVDLTVMTGSGPIASVNPSSLAFDLLVDESDSAELAIINSGNEAVTFDLLGSGNAASCFDPLDVEWLSTSVDSGSVAPSDALDLLVSVDATELAAGNYSTTLCLTTNDPAAPLIEVAVELTVSAATGGPVAAVDPGSFSLQLGPDDVAVESLLISNQGDELLTWDIETAEGASSRQFQRGGDIVTFPNVDFTPNPDFTGGAVQWLTGDTCDCDTAPFDFNPYTSPVQFFWPNNATQNVGGVSLDGGITYAVLEPGDAIGPASSFLAVTAVGATINWRQADGVEGYLGFQFDNPDTGQINYGYAHITTGDETGHPMTIHGWAFNQAGDPITVTPLGESAACDSPASIPWLSVDPASGSTAAGESSNVQLDIDTTGLANGQYQALLCISTNDADNELIEVPVWLEILEDALFADRFESDQGRSSEK